MSNTNPFLGTESNSALTLLVKKMINTRVNRLNDVAFDGRFSDMLQHEDFAVTLDDSRVPYVTIKSDSRIGRIHHDGRVYLSPVIETGANRSHFSLAVLVDKINPEEQFILNTCLFSSLHAKALIKAQGKTPARVPAHA